MGPHDSETCYGPCDRPRGKNDRCGKPCMRRRLHSGGHDCGSH
jgi:hypothetical protein